ncbi:nSTAND3 domain-containing NTPase [Aeromonas veronii]|uniref:nSTAND3 domain-containing NTPase n=1 Tax=Aeromonas veronii TaxID=654 RepID=UPI002B49A26E|nr:hypothetical protein [Aeromonas veronii]
MKKYTFEELNDIEFEDFVNDLLSCAYDWKIESFKLGRDFGIDGRSGTPDGDIIIQSKHYRKSGIDKLLREVERNEVEKARKINAKRYIFVTSLNLSPSNKDKIKIAFSGVNIDTADIIGNDELNALLGKNQSILIRWYKLWSESSEVLRLFINPAIKSRENILLSRLNKINKVFVLTEDIKPALSALNSEHVVVLSGEPGVGKTTLAEYLCQIYMKNGYAVEVIEGDVTNHHFNFKNPEEKIIYYFDDFLGSNYLSAISGNQDSYIVKIIEYLKNEPNKKLIVTSRTNIIQKAEVMSQAYRSFKLTSRQYIVKINNYSRLTKAKILYNHLWHSEFPLELKKEIIIDNFYNKIIDHRNFNPRLISFTMNLENRDENISSLSNFIYDNLEHPDQIWDHCYTVQLDEQARILVKLCIAAGSNISEQELECAYEKALSEFNFTSTTNQPKDFYHTAKLVCNSILLRYIRGDNAIYTHFNPSVTDYVIDKICSFSEARKLISSLNNTSVIKFYLDIIKAKKTNDVDAKNIADFMLNKFLNEGDQRFASALELGVFLLKMENKNLANAISIFNGIKKTSLEKMSPHTLSNILTLGHKLGIHADTYVEIISHSIFTPTQLNHIYQNIKDNKEMFSVISIIRKELREKLEHDIDTIIMDRDDFYDCDTPSELELLAVSTIERLAQDYNILTSDDLDVINENICIDFLMEMIKDRFRDCESNDPDERYMTDHHIKNKYSEQDEIDYMFGKYQE